MIVQADITAKNTPNGLSRADTALDCRPGSTLTPGAGLALPVIAPAEAKALNAFYRRRPPLAFAVAGHAATMKAPEPSASDDVSGRCRLDITVDGVPGALYLSRRLLEGAIAWLDPDQRLEHLDAGHLALLFELALTEAVSALEACLGSRLAIISVRPADDERSFTSLAFEVSVDSLGTTSVELLLQPGHAILFAQLLDRGAPPRSGEETEWSAIALPIPVCVRMAATTCAVGEIAALSPGDVVMADDHCQQTQTAVAVIGGHLAAPVELGEAGAKMTARPMRVRGSLWEWSMENGGNGSQTDILHKTDLDDIPVKLLFELGRVELSLAEIRQLAPGALIPIQRPLEESVDILANGRRIGRGNMVQIGDSLGIQITRLFDHA